MHRTGQRQMASRTLRTAIWGVLAAVGLWLGCSKPAAAPPPPAKGDKPQSPAAAKADAESAPLTLPEISPAELWAKVQKTYAEARTYVDNTTLVQRGISRARGTRTEMPFTQLTLAYERPNKYACSFEEALPSSQGRTTYRVASNGDRVRSRASEAADQVHETLAPRRVNLSNFIPEPQLRQAILQVAAPNLFPQLALLVRDEGSADVFPRASNMELLPAATLDDTPCYRLELHEPEGKRVCWIDAKRFVLLRMQLPIEGQLAQLDPRSEFRDLSVELDFRDVGIGPQIDRSAFELDVPDESRLVRRFVPPGPEELPRLLGEKLPGVNLRLAEGKRLTPQELSGKVVLFDFWTTDCQPCRRQMPLLEAAYQKLKNDHDNLEFYGVSLDPAEIETEQVEEVHKAWGGTFPVCRDTDRESLQKLDVQVTPTLIAIGTDGRVHVIQRGAIASTEVLERKLLQLLEGEDIAEQIRTEREKLVARHARSLEAATLETSLTERQTARAEPAPREIPDNVSLEELWITPPDAFEDAQSLWAEFDDSGKPAELVVLDSARLVKLSDQGAAAEPISLSQPIESENGFVRGTKGPSGQRWYLVSGVGWQRTCLFDDAWKQLLSFPDEENSGVGDGRLTLASGAETPTVLTGYWGGRGLEAGHVDGRRQWLNDYLDHVKQVTLQPSASEASAESAEVQEQAEAELCCTSLRGTLLRLNLSGQSIAEVDVPGYVLVQMGLPLALDQRASYCGLCATGPDAYAVVGFDSQGEEQWNYPLPRGSYHRWNCDYVRQVQLPGGETGWLALAADSSFHLLDAEGKLLANFNTGEQVRDFAVRATETGLHLYLLLPRQASASSLSWK